MCVPGLNLARFTRSYLRRCRNTAGASATSAGRAWTVYRLILTAVATYVMALALALPSAQTQPDGEFTFRFDTFGSEQLRALWQHPPYFHDGSAADLLAVVNRYNDDPRFLLGLTERQKADLVEFLKSL
jgi:cytochrome c peroxidase